MINKLNFFIIFLIISLTFVKSVKAILSINEIYPAPEKNDYEWVELYNNSNNSVDLTQYLLTDLANNKIKINEATLSAQSYLIASCSSILNNSGDTVFLKTINGEVIEIATYSGNFTSDKSYAKCPNGDWLTTNIITKNFSNETACLLPTPSDSENQPTNTPIPTSVSYNNIFLSEVYPYPDSGENEWVEIYNNNDFPVNLTNWYLDDIENGGSSPKLINLIIETKSYTVFDLTSSMFNNTGDSVRLLDFNKSLKDSFEYTGSEKGKSWGRITFDTDEFCLQEPSKNTQNSGCLNIDATAVPTPTILNYSKSITKQPPTLTKALINKPLINRPLPLTLQKPATSLPQVLGEKTKIPSSKNKQKTLAKTFSFIALSNSLLTIGSILLKIKVHETLGLFS